MLRRKIWPCNTVGEVLVYRELSRKTSLKKEHLSQDLNDKKDIAKQPFPREGQVVEGPKARMNFPEQKSRPVWLKLREQS